MNLKTFIIDSFTNIPFKGNPAGVCLLKKPINAETMQSIANELNLSETAFLLESKTNSNHYSIRYFTPTVEVNFCGHATLAASKIVLDKLNNSNVNFKTQKGLELSAKLEDEEITMKFPLYDTSEYIPNQKLLDAFGIENPISTKFNKDLDMLLIEVKDKQTLLNIKPNYQKAIKSSTTIKEVVVTSKSKDSNYDFYSRCFCPWIGINEDPVTGSSHSVLAKYWSTILNKTEMSAFQVSERGGFLNLKLMSDTELEVKSNARIVFEGEIKL